MNGPTMFHWWMSGNTLNRDSTDTDVYKWCTMVPMARKEFYSKFKRRDRVTCLRCLAMADKFPWRGDNNFWRTRRVGTCE